MPATNPIFAKLINAFPYLAASQAIAEILTIQIALWLDIVAFHLHQPHAMQLKRQCRL